MVNKTLLLTTTGYSCYYKNHRHYVLNVLSNNSTNTIKRYKIVLLFTILFCKKN